MFFSTAHSLKNMINFMIGKQKACILMGPDSAIKVCNKALVENQHFGQFHGLLQSHVG